MIFRKSISVPAMNISFLWLLTPLILIGLYLLFWKSPNVFEVNNNKKTIETLSSLDTDVILDAIVNASSQNESDENFVALTDAINKEVLDFIIKKEQLSKDDAEGVMTEYYADRSKIISGIHSVMRNSKIISENKSVQVYKTYNSVDDFVEALSGHACNFASFPLIARIKTSTARKIAEALAMRPPCRMILTEVLHPIATKLRDKAIIRDYNIVKFDFEKQIRNSILDLGTAEDNSQFRFQEQWVTETWLFDSSTELSANVESSVKAGFDLKQYFSMRVDHKSRRITIDLPEPKILSNQVKVYVSDENQGILSKKIDRDVYNQVYRQAEFRSEDSALRSGILFEAKQNANDVVHTIFQNVMSLPQFNYEIEVTFKGQRFNMDTKDESENIISIK